MKRWVKGDAIIYSPVTAQILTEDRIDVFEALCLIEDCSPSRLASQILNDAIDKEAHNHGIRAILEARRRYQDSLREVRDDAS